jgi:PKD repeat protein
LYDSISFIDASSSAATTIDSWIWDYGDGDSDTIFSPQSPDVTHLFGSVGKYSVTLTVIDNNGCVNSIADSVEILSKPLADFIFDTACLNFPVHFTDLSQNNGGTAINQWEWDFGDTASGSNNYSSLQNPEHIFSTNGIYTTTLIVTNTMGCDDTLIKSVTVDSLPDADFTMSTPVTCINNTVVFTGVSQETLTWDWDFGDGNTATGQIVSHSYTIAGNYVITATATNARGCVSTVSKFVSVTQSTTVDFSYSVIVCDTIQFTDQSVPPAGYNLVLWHWDFGDGDTSDIQNPVHVYDTGGIYNVTLLVTADSLGYMCTDTVTKQVSVPLTPDIFYTWTPAPTCFGDSTTFHGTSGFPISTWHWDFDDGYFGTDSIVNHMYSDTGYYNVLLTITDTNGCINSLSHVVEVVPLPDLSMTLSDTVLCSGGEVICSGSSSDSITSWYWDFGDGSFSVNQNTTHYYGNGGTYQISLTATDTSGCSTTIIKSVIVSPSPVAGYSYSVISCTQLSFTDLSTAPSGYNIVGWNWDFDDGTTSTLQNPVHDFPSSGGLYNVRLVVTSDSSGYSCSDTITQGVIVPEQPSLFFTWDPEPTMLGNSTSFYGTSGNTITSWDWDFGDGTFSTLQNPTHTYGFVGTFTVTLTVTDDSGCSNSVSHDVTVVNVPGLDFTWGTSCEGSPTQFYIDQSVTNVNAVVSWFWDFGDGGTSVDMEPQHTYMTSGTYDVSLTIVDTMNATNTVLHVVTVHPLPVVNFGYEQPVCQGNYTQFHDYSSSPSGYITQWIWDFGDGSDTTVYFPGNPDVTHLYTSSGTYTVTLTVLNSDSCSNSNINDITIQPSPVALFTHSNGNCSSQPVQFTDQSNSNGGGAIVGWLWNFGDPSSGSSNTSTLQNPSHLFSSPGTYTVLLSIENVNGCIDTTSETLTINDNPGVDFSYTTACLGQETHFYVDTTVTNVQEVALYAWDFGDGGTSNLPNPTHVYGTQGIYNVTLTITTNDGCTAVAQHMVPIKPLPTANFASTSPVCYGDTVYFTNLSSSPNGLISRWDWDFGDGTTVTINYPDDPDVSHYYSNSTTFAVVLTVTDTSGCVNSVTKLIEVVPNPIADFSYEESCYGEPVFFTDLSSSNAGPDLSTWDWYFGDPNSGTSNHSTLQNPTHVYTEPGTYTTTLIISNTLGCSDTTTQDIIVDTLPYVAISIEDDSICLNEPAVFTGIGTDINSWYWQFGDGGTSIEQNPTYQYSSPGTYVVTLTVTGIDGCENSTTDTIHVNDTPDADFTYENTCINDSTYFVDASSSSNGYITSWSWDFGDGGSSTEPNPVHLYASRDSYQVVLVVTDNFGCSDTVSRWVEVYDRPHPGFSYNQVCEPAGQVYFFDESEPGEDGSPIEEWNWNLYDGYYSSEINPSYIYPRTDTCYNVTLTVTDANGCSSSDTVEVCLFGTITADFSSTEECEGQLTLFTASYSPYSDSVISYTWDFHDGTPLDSTYHDTISHLFPSAGTYLVELTVKDTNGCNYHAYNEVVVDSLPVPRFSYTAGFCDEPTIFTDESFGGGTFIQSWYWDFGDINSGSANYSTEQNPSHYYGPLDSTYIVKLVVTNFNGCSDSIEQAVEISPCLESGFSMIDSIVPCSGKVVLFNDTSRISSNNGDITGWYWDFGDGNTISYSSYEPVVEHIYVNPGVYEVTLVITADIGGNVYSDTTGMSIEVYPTPESGISVANSCYGDSTYFYYAGSGNGEPVSYWHWDFDTTSLSGDTSNIKDAVYKYPAYGSYISSLSVWNKYGCSDTAYKEVTIYKPPVADFEYEATCMSYYTYFSDNTRADSSAIEYWRWDFDTTSANPPFSYDDTSNLQNPQYIYDSSGHYVVELITVDGHQCRDTVMKEIEIYPKPTAAFNLIDEYNNEQGQIYLENLSKNAIEYVWDFGNGIVSNETNPVYQYDEDGKYDIMLIAYNSYRCPDTAETVYDLMFTKLYVPNAFVPSSENPEIKVFKPKGTNLRRYTLEIYSGWGNLLFKSSKLEDGTPAEGWDGTYNGQDMPTGTYIWHIRAEFKDGTYWRGSDNGDGNINTSGTLTLIR